MPATVDLVGPTGTRTIPFAGLHRQPGDRPDQETTLRNWWEAMPGYVDRAQYMLEQVQDAVEGIAEKGEALRRVLSRRSPTIPA